MSFGPRDLPEGSDLSYTGAFSITPSDAADLAEVPRAIFATGAGDIAMTLFDGSSFTYTATAGEIVPFIPSRVLATGTTATGLIGLK